MCIKAYVVPDPGHAALRHGFRAVQPPVAMGLTCIKVDVAPR
jgi:hypothetical protein